MPADHIVQPCGPHTGDPWFTWIKQRHLMYCVCMTHKTIIEILLCVSEAYDDTVSGGQTQAVIWVFSEMVLSTHLCITYEQHYNKENKWGYRTS